MFYFFPKIYYKINSYDYLRVTDISITTKLRSFLNLYRQTNLRPYVVRDGETPDLVSYRVYGSPKYDYIVLMSNDIRNYYDEWPMSYTVLNEYIEQKYGSIEYARTNYAKYYTSDNEEISADAWQEQSIADPTYYRVSYYDYEMTLNDNKSKIKLLNPSLVVQFEVELQQLLSEIQRVEE